MVGELRVFYIDIAVVLNGNNFRIYVDGSLWLLNTIAENQLRLINFDVIEVPIMHFVGLTLHSGQILG